MWSSAIWDVRILNQSPSWVGQCHWRDGDCVETPSSCIPTICALRHPLSPGNHCRNVPQNSWNCEGITRTNRCYGTRAHTHAHGHGHTKPSALALPRWDSCCHAVITRSRDNWFTTALCHYSTCHLIGSLHHVITESDPCKTLEFWRESLIRNNCSAMLCPWLWFNSADLLRNVFKHLSCHLVANVTCWSFVFFTDVCNLVLDNCSFSDRDRWWFGQAYFFVSWNVAEMEIQITFCPNVWFLPR